MGPLLGVEKLMENGLGDSLLTLSRLDSDSKLKCRMPYKGRRMNMQRKEVKENVSPCLNLVRMLPSINFSSFVIPSFLQVLL